MIELPNQYRIRCVLKVKWAVADYGTVATQKSTTRRLRIASVCDHV